MSRARLALALQKLSMKEFIQTGEQADVVLLAAAEPVLAELGTARKDYEMAKYAGFSGGGDDPVCLSFQPDQGKYLPGPKKRGHAGHGQKKKKPKVAQSIDKNYMDWSGNRLILLDETLRE